MAKPGLELKNLAGVMLFLKPSWLTEADRSLEEDFSNVSWGWKKVRERDWATDWWLSWLSWLPAHAQLTLVSARRDGEEEEEDFLRGRPGVEAVKVVLTGAAHIRREENVFVVLSIVFCIQPVVRFPVPYPMEDWLGSLSNLWAHTQLPKKSRDKKKR